MTAPPPEWMRRLQQALDYPDPEYFARFQPPPEGGRESAVLMLFAPSEHGGEDVVLTERAHDMRSHPGQVSFPGGSLEPGERPTEAALREAHDEVGIDPATVEVVAELPQLFLTPSRFVVTPVLAWWPVPAAFGPIDAREVHRAERLPIDRLLDPAIRFTVTHPAGYEGPAFEVDGLYVWGFTAMLFSRVMQLAGLEQVWDVENRQPLPERFYPGMAPDLSRGQASQQSRPGGRP
jgi:8-oxo-dGTP pyrophosphatase MutT (NUDIX family)